LDEEKFRNGHIKDEVHTTFDDVDNDDTQSFKNLSID